ncbi:MAG: hypothetical protein ACJAW3_001387 [Lentimonas sp.]|jgi:hypothetical protein
MKNNDNSQTKSTNDSPELNEEAVHGGNEFYNLTLKQPSPNVKIKKLAVRPIERLREKDKGDNIQGRKE